MEAAKAAVQKLTGNRGHQTSVEETVVPAVTHEAVKPHRHEETTQAVDREVHQHHHHTTVQPLSHQERLPEKHTHQLQPAEHREFHHDNESSTKERLAAEMAQFKGHSETHETHHTQAAAPTVTGEHVHHHVHETVVPVVHKETIQPEVVHTTVPIHETHHAAAQHHGLSALPMKTLDEFKAAGGALTGGNHASREEYQGAPRPYNDKLSTTFEKLEEKFHHGGHASSGSSTGNHNLTEGTASATGNHGVTSGNIGTTGTTGSHGLTSGTTDASGLSNSSKTHRPTDSGIGGIGGDMSQGVGKDHHNTPGITGSSLGNDSLGQRGSGPMGTTEPLSGTNTKKPSLMDRLNPRVDADGDGKRGMMD